MVTHMKTTIEIADALLKRAQAAARSEGVTLRSLVEQGLREVLGQRAQARKEPFRLRRTKARGGGFMPGFENAAWPALRDEIYRGHGA